MSKTLLTTFQFIEKANKIHDNTYNYTQSKYINSQTKIKIICHIHGEFYQTPNSHLRNRGCPVCGIIKCRKKMADTLQQFICKSKKIHGNIYDYSKVKYVNNTTKVCIVCPIHGNFLQRPNNHINMNNGCLKCGRDKFGKRRAKTKFQFIKESNLIHKNVYSYSKIIYK